MLFEVMIYIFIILFYIIYPRYLMSLLNATVVAKSSYTIAVEILFPYPRMLA